jgi:uncharacterized RDD family membrane protein YckC
MPFVAGELDSRIAIVTPEHIAFHYRLAGPFRRLIAYAIDVVLRLLVSLGLLIILALSGILVSGVGIGLMLVAWFIISWFYGGLFETFWNGQTPGKWLMRLRVLTHDGQPINALQAVLRNILRAVDAMPVVPLPWLEHAIQFPVFSLGLVTMAMTDRYERWGDLACGTMVVVEDRRLLRGVIQMDDAAVREMAATLPANYTPSPSLARAISVYVERRRYFGPGRRAEIARIVGEPLCQRFGLPADTSHDLLLCALYYHTFIVERGARQPSAAPIGATAAATSTAEAPTAASSAEIWA